MAANLFDRFLCACVVQRTQLQLLGAVCLLLASKLRQCRPLSVELLAYYTDYSVTQQEIRVSTQTPQTATQTVASCSNHTLIITFILL